LQNKIKKGLNLYN